MTKQYVSKRLSADVELRGDSISATTRADEFEDLLPELRRVDPGWVAPFSPLS